MPHSPVFIPSRARAGLVHLHDLSPILIVVEHHEAAAYREAYGPDRTLSMGPEVPRGIVVKRQWILDYARRAGIKKFWMVDDDVLSFARDEHPSKASVALAACEKVAERYGYVLLAPSVSFLAFHAPRDITRTAKLLNCVFFNDFPSTVNYDQRLRLQSDVDLAISTDRAGYRIARYERVTYRNRPPEEAGGRDFLYREGEREQATQRMLKKWPGICKSIMSKDGRVTVRVRLPKGDV